MPSQHKNGHFKSPILNAEFMGWPTSNPFKIEDTAYFAMRRKAKNYRLLEINNQTAGLPLKEGFGVSI